VPDTWEELEETAAKIQAKQKEKELEFIGFAWQGAAEYEGLTCNALEWIASEGALDADTGLPDFDHEGVLNALDRARGWVNGENAISPYARHHMEQDSLQTFVDGKAAFYRGWSTDYVKLKQSEIAFGMAPLPVPERRKGEKSSSVLGGWQLAVPKDSLIQGSAIRFIRYLSSPEVQEWRVREGTYQPTIKNLEVQENLPFLKDKWFQDIQLIVRPSSRLGNRYNEVSTCIYKSVDAALGRNSRDEIKQDIENMENCIVTCLQSGDLR
jgi:trehalose/maltose transport system substrate-binding protein